MEADGRRAECDRDWGRNVHLGIKDAQGSIDDANSRIVDIDGIDILAVLNGSRQVQTELCGMQVCADGVLNCLGLTTGDIKVWPGN